MSPISEAEWGLAMNNFYNEILTEHNVRPEFKYDLPCPTIQLEGVNPNCGDDIWLNLQLKDGVIEDASFNGDGCAISQASADIMIGMIVGKTEAEASGRSVPENDQGNCNVRGTGRAGRGICPPGYFTHAGQSKMCCAGVAYTPGSAEKRTQCLRVVFSDSLQCNLI